ncbi:MAG: cytochrome b5 domain-containing protein [bacterium]
MKSEIIKKIVQFAGTNLGLAISVIFVGGFSSVFAFQLARNVAPILPIGGGIAKQEEEQESNVVADAEIPIVALADNSGGTTGFNGCLVTLSGKQYDVTTLRKSHSGGDVFQCGTDMTAKYIAQHGSDLSRMQRYLYVPGKTITAVSNPNTGNNSPAGTATFDAASLATHNKSGDCYVAYNGIVYSVSSNAQWGGCRHNGITGGQDITSRFPHPTSYLSSLPKVGSFITTNPQQPNPNNNNNDQENEQEQEQENNQEESQQDRKSEPTERPEPTEKPESHSSED